MTTKEQEVIQSVNNLAVCLDGITSHLLNEKRSLEQRERDYQILLIELDKAGIRPLNRASPELLKYFPEYAQSCD